MKTITVGNQIFSLHVQCQHNGKTGSFYKDQNGNLGTKICADCAELFESPEYLILKNNCNADN